MYRQTWVGRQAGDAPGKRVALRPWMSRSLIQLGRSDLSGRVRQHPCGSKALHPIAQVAGHFAAGECYDGQYGAARRDARTVQRPAELRYRYAGFAPRYLSGEAKKLDTLTPGEPKHRKGKKGNIPPEGNRSKPNVAGIVREGWFLSLDSEPVAPSEATRLGSILVWYLPRGFAPTGLHTRATGNRTPRAPARAVRL
jgi:hypothetical protein